jgi:lipopolysaccharide export system permease protein
MATTALGNRRGSRRIRLSLTLFRYIGLQVASGIGIAILALAVLALLVDAVELLRRTGERAEAGAAIAAVMAVLHLPSLVQKLVPFGVLFGTMYCFQRLTRTNELVAARAIGVSVWQFLLPAVSVAVLLGVFLVVAFNPLAAALSARYEQLEAAYLSARPSLISVSGGKLWLRQTDGDREIIIHAQELRRDPPVLVEVIFFFFEHEVEFTARADAPLARLEPGRWVLIDPVVLRADGGRETPGELTVPTTLSPGRIENSFASPQTISFWDLPEFIRSIETVGFSAREHRLHWHSMLALPLLLAAMLVVGTTFSLRLARRGKAGVMVVAGLAAGFAFYILSDVVFAIGLSGRLPIALAAWAPAGIAMLLGLATLFHIEDG